MGIVTTPVHIGAALVHKGLKLIICCCPGGWRRLVEFIPVAFCDLAITLYGVLSVAWAWESNTSMVEEFTLDGSPRETMGCRIFAEASARA
eukprot:12406068-Karenia_brevis.AAC.1